ncbi:hypothetical protein COS81_04790, partial [candidate division WWE3 bacterium CG06_land_8_20_14_3_00_42_16]
QAKTVKTAISIIDETMYNKCLGVNRIFGKTNGRNLIFLLDLDFKAFSALLFSFSKVDLEKTGMLTGSCNSAFLWLVFFDKD